DVDTGSPETGSPERTVLGVNLAAAAVIARQLRLRQLGGGIVIDFVGLDRRGAREEVRDAIAAALGGDPAQPPALGSSRPRELARPRRLRPLSEAMADPAASAFAALRAVWREARAHPAANWRLAVSPSVAMALAGPAAQALRALETRLGRHIAVVEVGGGGT